MQKIWRNDRQRKHPQGKIEKHWGEVIANQSEIERYWQLNHKNIELVYKGLQKGKWDDHFRRKYQ